MIDKFFKAVLIFGVLYVTIHIIIAIWTGAF